jgi:type IV pilus assembly protein PilC
MAVYQYLAKDQSGKKFSGIYTDIENTRDLRRELAKVGCELIKAHREKHRTAKRCKVKRREVVTFAYRFASMYAAGLPILNCLATLEEQTENQGFKSIISEIRKSIQAGSNLKDACSKHADIFSNFFLGMVEAGESSGRLADTLNLSAAYLEKREDTIRKVISAFAYPVIVTTMCLGAIIFLLTFVMPTFEELYRQVHVSLPGPTLAIIAVSDFIIEKWYTILVIVALTIIGTKWMSKRQEAQIQWDAFKLKIPLFGKLNRMLVVSHFIRSFATLTSVGVALIEAMDISCAVSHNHKMTGIVKDLEQMIKAGIPISLSFKSFKIFPSIIPQLAATGEESGQLSEMLNKGADLIDKDIDATVNSLIAKLEPALTILMGLIVGLLLIGAYLPMFDYMSHLQ